MPKYSFNTQAFTLIELVMTMAIAGILVTIAIPSFNSTLTSIRLTSYANDLVGALNLARSEAIRRGIKVTVRKFDNHSCPINSVIGTNGANWEDGWHVFTDTDMSNVGKCVTGDELIRAYPPLMPSYIFRGNNNISNYISFLPSGQSNINGSFVICNNSDGLGIPKANTSRLIIIDNIGRVRMGLDTNNDRIPNTDNTASSATNITSCTPPFS
ncbi:MAG: GspH/FimT family pseudopilin [Methylococcaceae bacterium]